MPLAVYSKKRSNGELTAFVGMYATGGLPMMSNIMDVFFGGDRDYANDPMLQKALEAGAIEFDSAARNKIYGPAIDLVNEKAYILPIAEVPMAWAHSKDVKLLPNTLSTLTPRLGDYAWSDYKD
jgi:ABC-type transport system substrate-binding protein